MPKKQQEEGRFNWACSSRLRSERPRKLWLQKLDEATVPTASTLRKPRVRSACTLLPPLCSLWNPAQGTVLHRYV